MLKWSISILYLKEEKLIQSYSDKKLNKHYLIRKFILNLIYVRLMICTELYGVHMQHGLLEVLDLPLLRIYTLNLNMLVENGLIFILLFLTSSLLITSHTSKLPPVSLCPMYVMLKSKYMIVNGKMITVVFSGLNNAKVLV